VLQPNKDHLASHPEAIDPRDYLKTIDVGLLRRDPAGTDLEEVMELILVRVADHVEKLVHEFGCAGLAGKVESLTLDQAAEYYAKK
jgi:hypothetical protein